jgi:hypothetical protein
MMIFPLFQAACDTPLLSAMTPKSWGLSSPPILTPARGEVTFVIASRRRSNLIFFNGLLRHVIPRNDLFNPSLRAAIFRRRGNLVFLSTDCFGRGDRKCRVLPLIELRVFTKSLCVL